MLALGLRRGLNFFWSPNFDSKPSTHAVAAKPDTPTKEPRKKPVRCKTMQALQRALSEAQKIGFGVDTLKGLIKTHKATCSLCHPSA